MPGLDNQAQRRMKISWILQRWSFTLKRHRQLRVNDLPMVFMYVAAAGARFEPPPLRTKFAESTIEPPRPVYIHVHTLVHTHTLTHTHTHTHIHTHTHTHTHKTHALLGRASSTPYGDCKISAPCP